jgi:isopenicillin-N synthase
MYGSDLSAKMNVARQIDAACRINGFFQISNHGVDLTGVNNKALAFFKSLSAEEKFQLASRRFNPKSKNTYRGYTAASVSGKETFDIGNKAFDSEHALIKAGVPLHDVQVWPKEEKLPGFREFFENYFVRMLELSRVVLRGFALALGKEESFWDDKVNLADSMTTLRLNFYPFLDDIEPVETGEDGTKLGCPTHKDSVLITIILQETKGFYIIYIQFI